MSTWYNMMFLLVILLSSSFLVRSETTTSPANQLGVSESSTDQQKITEPPPNQTPVITHTVVVRADLQQPIPISVEISNSMGEIKNAKVFYRPLGNSIFQTVDLSRQSGDIFTAEIPAQDEKVIRIAYYISVTDAQGEEITHGSRNDPNQILANRKPVIVHTEITRVRLDSPVSVLAEITDSTERVVSAEVFHRTTGDSLFNRLELIFQSGKIFEVEIPAPAVQAAGLEYYISATDNHGLVSTHGSAEEPHQVRVRVPPPFVSFSQLLRQTHDSMVNQLNSQEPNYTLGLSQLTAISKSSLLPSDLISSCQRWISVCQRELARKPVAPPSRPSVEVETVSEPSQTPAQLDEGVESEPSPEPEEEAALPTETYTIEQLVGIYTDAVKNYAMKGQSEEAINRLKLIVELQINHRYLMGNSYFWLGVCHRRLGMYDKAIQYFNGVTNENSFKFKEAQVQLGLIPR